MYICTMTKSMKTFQFRIKDSKCFKQLEKHASAVNLVWNYCNDTSQQSAKKRSAGSNNRWISEFDLNYLTAGTSKALGLSSTTIQSIAGEFVNKRNARKRPRLKWRSYKKNLGWIPVKAGGISFKDDSFKYCGKGYRFWKSREIEGKVKTASITQDAQRRWYINVTCEVPECDTTKSTSAIGVDLGLKDLAVCSDGHIIQNPRTLRRYADKLAVAQRAKKKKQVIKIHAKIKNVRKDFLHKASTALVKKHKQIFVGNVSSSKLVKTKMAKSVLDAGWNMFKTMLKYKSIRIGVDYQETDERYSTVTCSDCFARSGPSGLSALGIRDWVCSKCGSQHLRDVNAAKNILNFALGHQSQLVESPAFR